MAVGVSPWWLWDHTRMAVGPEPHGCGWLWVALIQQLHGRGARLRVAVADIPHSHGLWSGAVERGWGAWPWWMWAAAVVHVGRGCGWMWPQPRGCGWLWVAVMAV